jgi:polyribonucleotide nucleotidyltransferase
MIMYIKPDQIRDVIGPGGKMITSIIERADGVKIDIDQDGKVFIMHTSMEPIKKAMQIIKDLTKEAEVGEVYQGVVKRIEKFGCFVELWSGTEGLVHVSKLDHKRVENVEDVVKLGDKINVKVIKIDEKGRIDLSRKDTLPVPEKAKPEAHE